MLCVLSTSQYCSIYKNSTTSVASLSVKTVSHGIGRNASCTLGDCLASRPEGCSQSTELLLSSLFIHIRESIVLVYRVKVNGFSGDCTLICRYMYMYVQEGGGRVGGRGEGEVKKW